MLPPEGAVVKASRRMGTAAYLGRQRRPWRGRQRLAQRTATRRCGNMNVIVDDGTCPNRTTGELLRGSRGWWAPVGAEWQLLAAE